MGVQGPCSHIRLDEAAHIYNPGVLTERWEVEIEEFPEVLSKLRDSVPQNRESKDQPLGVVL